MNRKLSKGFTLVEIMIVVAIIAILAAVAIPNFVKYRKTSQASACIANLKQIQSAKEQWMMSHTTVPADLSAIAGDKDKLLKTMPACPAGGTYTIGADDVDPTCSLGKVDTDDQSTWHLLDKGTGTGS